MAPKEVPAFIPGTCGTGMIKIGISYHPGSAEWAQGHHKVTIGGWRELRVRSQRHDDGSRGWSDSRQEPPASGCRPPQGARKAGSLPKGHIPVELLILEVSA